MNGETITQKDFKDGKPRCPNHRCFLINLKREGAIGVGQCPDSGCYFTYASVDKTKNGKTVVKKKYKIVNGQMKLVTTKQKVLRVTLKGGE